MKICNKTEGTIRVVVDQDGRALEITSTDDDGQVVQRTNAQGDWDEGCLDVVSANGLILEVNEAGILQLRIRAAAGDDKPDVGDGGGQLEEDSGGEGGGQLEEDSGGQGGQLEEDPGDQGEEP